MLYNAELALAFDKDAAESLVSMFCDAHFWLSSDAETVASSDHRFTSLVGRDMTGEVISSLFQHSAEDWLRLQMVPSEAPIDNMPAPVTVLPVTLPDASGAAINVDLYIVGCRTRSCGSGPRCDRSTGCQQTPACRIASLPLGGLG